MDKYRDKDILINFLGKISLFQKAEALVLEHLTKKIMFTSYSTGQTIINKGDVGNTMYLIFSGELKVHDGEHRVATLKQGEFFGELSLLDSEPRSMSVTADDESVLGTITRSDFYEVLKEYPEMMKDIIAALNNRLRSQNEVLISEFKSREAQLTNLVKVRTHELEQKNIELELAMDNLKKSQVQLIQSEKLASLGKLTAGIAHEILNPLNFVNNFSKFSLELAEEILSDISVKERIEVSNDLKQNLTKIHHHGKRAESIVKNMLDHARTSKGSKQLIDMNSLCEEYLNLSYHGTRANQSDFNCEILMELDVNLPKIEAVTQDISRVLINLFNNAFYAIRDQKNGIVKVKTMKSDEALIIEVSDNGSGIASDILEKIFEPFFTTKPTGEGTGLGLSLSYDIIKSHGGEIAVKSDAVGNIKGSVFSVILPYHFTS